MRVALTRSEALTAAIGAVTLGAASPAFAALVSPASTWLLQSQLVQEHADRFSRGSQPAAVDSLVYNGRRIRQLVASIDVPAYTRVAAYPVELAYDVDEFDDTYAMRIYRQVGQSRQAIDGASGILTDRSLARTYVGRLPTIAMYANEPDASQEANCVLFFPTVRSSARLHRGDVLYGYLETKVPVEAGAPLTWCYSPSGVERIYPTSCTRTRAAHQEII